jgi:hypothetical protein
MSFHQMQREQAVIADFTLPCGVGLGIKALETLTNANGMVLLKCVSASVSEANGYSLGLPMSEVVKQSLKSQEKFLNRAYSEVAAIHRQFPRCPGLEPGRLDRHKIRFWKTASHCASR